MSERTLASMAREDYERRLSLIVDGLRRLADEVEREGRVRDRPSFDGTPAFATAAQRAQHALFWGIANLGVEYLVDAAGRADRYAAEEPEPEDETEPEPERIVDLMAALEASLAAVKKARTEDGS